MVPQKSRSPFLGLVICASQKRVNVVGSCYKLFIGERQPGVVRADTQRVSGCIPLSVLMLFPAGGAPSVELPAHQLCQCGAIQS